MKSAILHIAIKILDWVVSKIDFKPHRERLMFVHGPNLHTVEKA